MDLLKYRAFPELADAVRQRKDEVMRRWLDAVRESLPAAGDLATRQVRNSLPDTLDIMAAALEADDPRPTKELMDTAVSHGETRFDQNFALGELMIEYGLLRPILIEEAADHLDRSITVEEIVALNLAVDIATRRGVTAYVNQQKAELNALVEAQTKYLSFLSHDLRGGLNGVLLMIEVLRRDLERHSQFAESLNDLDVMRRSILDTVSTMDRFLHAERFRRGKVQVRPSAVDLEALLAEVAGHFSYQAKEKSLEITPEAPPKTSVNTDKELLAIILQNLVGNAVKYANDGTIRIVASADVPATRGSSNADHGGASANPAARLSVIDQGPGIDPAKLNQLFQPFSRGETHGQEGIGLGLSIARQAADLLGAKLWAESQPGQGSSFHIDLPAQPPAISVASET